MNDSASKVIDVEVGTKSIEPTIDMNKSFYIHEDLEIDLKQVEDPDMEDLDLKSLSINSKAKKSVQFASPIFTLNSEIQSHATEKAMSDAVIEVCMSGKLKKKNKKKSRVQMGKHYNCKRLLNFSKEDEKDI